MYHKLLARQIKRSLKGLEEIPEDFKTIFQAISDAYAHYESNSNLLERSIELSSEELNQANASLRTAKAEIEQKNKDIMDSIKYAKRIQDAILPTERLMNQLLSGSFILFQPKDIVSGDFYWAQHSRNGLLIAAVDCTGHGVPGAFMCMIGNALLNEIVKEKSITKPDEVLNMLRDGVIGSLRQKGEEGESKDGMDICLCNVNTKTMTLDYAGANNPLYIIRNGELTEYKADKQPIGYYLGSNDPFTNKQVEIQEGDSIYIFSDGYPDQFGGPNGKKFKYRPFKELLISIQDRSMQEQGDILDKKMKQWKGELEQVDDICVLGIRI